MSERRLCIRGGRVIDPDSGHDGVADLWIAEGRILALGPAPADFTPDRVIDARGRVVCPGLVDLCARLREPGAEHKATIASETRAAAHRGITTLCCPPDTDPVIDTPAVVELVHQRAEAAGFARVVTLGALTRGLDGEQLSEMAALRDAGCPAVGNARRPLASTLVLRRALEYAATFGLTVMLDPEDEALAAGGCAHAGLVATRLGLPSIPAAAETAAVARDLALVEETGVRAHFCHLTTARAVRMIARARYDGVPVTADVAAPYLFLTEMDLAGFDSNCHLRPPLRSQRDLDALRRGLAEGTLSVLCSDHQPHEADAKLAPFPATEPGMSGLDTLPSLALRLVEDGVIGLPDAIARLTLGPARVLGLDAEGIGTLRAGAPADVAIIDTGARWRVGADSIESKGQNTAFGGWELPGRVTHTLFRGRLVHEAGA